MPHEDKGECYHNTAFLEKPSVGQDRRQDIPGQPWAARGLAKPTSVRGVALLPDRLFAE